MCKIRHSMWRLMCSTASTIGVFQIEHWNVMAVDQKERGRFQKAEVKRDMLCTAILRKGFEVTDTSPNIPVIIKRSQVTRGSFSTGDSRIYNRLSRETRYSNV